MSRSRFIFVVLGALWLWLPGALAARALHWSALEVEAALDADGRLHVVERHTMVFSGDWNGGERVFRVRPGQRLELAGVRRVDPVRGTVELERGDLDLLDRYDWESRNRLRWRSRLPSDPPFDATTLVYDLEYTLSGILEIQRDEGEEAYSLDHDFAFPDRVGRIERFRLELDIDPAWAIVSARGDSERLLRAQPVRIERGALGPGESVVLTFVLARPGGAPPTAVRGTVGATPRVALALGLLAALGLRALGFVRFESRQGRFAGAPSPSVLDHSWLEQHLLDLLPEEAGALWDQAIGSPEVTALLARLIAEGKLASSVATTSRRTLFGGSKRRQALSLELRVDRHELEGYELELIDKLFFDGRTKTDTDAIREEYRSSGFSPASTIRSGLLERLRRLPELAEPLPKPSKLAPILLVVAGVACLALEGWRRGEDAVGPAVGLLIFALLMTVPVVYVIAWLHRRRADRLTPWTIALLAPMALAAGGLAWAIYYGPDRIPDVDNIGIFGLAALALLPLGFFLGALNLARTRDRPPAVAARQRLALVRRYFAEQLDQAVPALENGWQPYLLAFGLGKEMERWYRSYGGASPDAGELRVAEPASTRTHYPHWTGGAVTHAGWAEAVRSMAAGVASPSSGGGGVGGGGSSGGGGGGGW